MSTAITGSSTVVAVDPRTDRRWHTIALTAGGSLFTSPPWIRSVCDTYGFTPQARIVIDDAGRPTDGFTWVPISDIRGDRLVSLPFSDRAEPLVADRATWSSLVNDALSINSPLRIRCLTAAAPTADAGFVRTGEAAWHCTPLGVSVPELHRSLRSSARRNIATADRKGVQVDEVTGIDAVRIFHRLHVSLRKHKYRLLAQPLALFERIWHEFAWDEGIVTFLAHVDGEPIAGAVYLIWNGVAYYKFGASLEGTLPFRPNDALAWAALRWATERGFHRLDWGLSDIDQPGLIEFKRKWASEEGRIVTLRSMTADLNGGQDAGHVLAQLTRLFTDDAVPDHITERAGSLLYRYFT